MNKFHEQLKREADALRLSDAERESLRADLISYMEYHPLPEGEGMHAARELSKVAVVFGFFQNFYARRALGALAVILVASVPFVAERSMPGDILYPVKVQFNEELKSSLTRSPYEKIAWETERLERRLAEARLLASEGKLTPEMEADVAAAVTEHSNAAQQSIDSIRMSDSDEAALAEITLSSALDVQSELLEGHSVTLAGAVDAARQVAAESREQNKPSYEKLLARIEQESTNAYELFNTIAPDATETERRDMEDKLDDIQQDVAEAQALESSNPTEAVVMLSGALADLRKAISFMSDVNVRVNVSLDELIPEELTDEERTALVQERITETEAIIALANERAEVVDENTRQAVTLRITEIETHLDTASSTLAAGDLTTADETSLAAHALALELDGVLDAYEAENGSTAPATTTSSTTQPNTGTSTPENDQATSTPA